MADYERNKLEGLCERDRINARTFMRWYITFSLLFGIGIIILGPVKGGIAKTPLWHWALALLPVVPAFFTLNAYHRFIKVADELIKHVHFEAATKSFILMIFLGYILPGHTTVWSVGRLRSITLVYWTLHICDKHASRLAET